MSDSSELISALRPVLFALRELGVPCRIGGSVASSAYGVARTTMDVDLVAEIHEQHVRPLVEALSNGYYVDEGAVRDAVRRQACFNLIHHETMLKVDVFVLKRRAYDLAAFARVRLEEIAEGDAVEFCSPEDIVLNKLEWYRVGREVSERQWNDVLGVLRVQAGALDWAYMEAWACELGVADLLTLARKAAGEE